MSDELIYDCCVGFFDDPPNHSACQYHTGRHDLTTVKKYRWSGYRNSRVQVSGIIKLCEYHVANAISLGWTGYINSSSRLILVDEDIVVNHIVKELPCRSCHRMNDLNVAKCWLCECPNPNGT